VKTIGLIGLAVLTALVLSASVGAVAASAANTALCKTSTYSPVCGTGEAYASGSAISAKTTAKLTLANVSLNDKCNSTLEGTIGAAGDPLSVSISKWSFSNCTCETSFVETPSASLKWSEGTDGKLTLSTGAGSPRLHVNCFGIYDCVYSFPSSVTFKGGNPAQLAIAETKLTTLEDKHTYGGGCPESTLQPATFEVTSPNPAYVATVASTEAHTRLCKVVGSSCAASNTYPLGTKIEAEASNFKVSRYNDTFVCKKATIGGVTQAIGAEPLPLGSVDFSGSECSSNVFGSSCTMTHNNPSTGATLERGGVLEATWQFATAFHFTLTCKSLGGTVTNECEYGNVLNGQIHNGEPAMITFEGVELSLVREGGSWPCTSPALLSGTFTVASPNPLYVI
jgi:hypothetical protein